MDVGPLWLLSYKQQSLAYSNMCYLLWSHIGSSFLFIFFKVVEPIKYEVTIIVKFYLEQQATDEQRLFYLCLAT